MKHLTCISKTAVTLLAIILMAALAGCDDEGADKMNGSETQKTKLDTAKQPPTQSGKFENATFAAGCFWGVEASFRSVEGVVATSVGYTGGQLINPTYKDVCTDKTGHAEAVEVIYDPSKVSFESLLEVFWKIHDPTTLNRQGPDIGAQYRSAVFYHNTKQHVIAQQSMEKLRQTGKFDKPIVTRIIPASKFYKAEEYHQKYLEKQGKTSCSSTIKH